MTLSSFTGELGRRTIDPESRERLKSWLPKPKIDPFKEIDLHEALKFREQDKESLSHEYHERDVHDAMWNADSLPTND